MLHSQNFAQTTIIIGGQQYRMEYDLAPVNNTSIRGLGNIYIDEENPLQFTFFTINNEIGGYTL